MPRKKTAAGEEGDGVGDERESTKNASTTASDSRPNTFVPDPWSEEQETCLLKGIIRWKPVGMHKHFRMVAIWNYMRSQGYAPPSEPHTRIPGIWKKLATLYNLEGLDEREEPVFTEGSEASDEDAEYYCPFELPEDDYGSSMFDRRLALDGTSSPSLSAVGGASMKGGTYNDTDEASSPTPSSRTRSRPMRQSRPAGRKTRSTRAQTDSRDEEDESGDNESDSNNDNESSGSSDNYEEEPSYSQPTRSTRGQTMSQARARRSRVTKRGR